MSEEAPTLKWGDIIRIHGVNLSRKQEKKTRGLIVSKGFTDPNIYYQKYENFQDVNLYRQSLFQILPRSNFDIHDQMMQPNINNNQKQLLKLRAHNQIDGLQKMLEAKAGGQIMYGSQVIFQHVQSKSYLRGILKAADTGEGAFKIQVTQNLSSQLIFRIVSHRSYQHQNDKIYYDDALQIYHPGADCYMNFAQNISSIYLDKNLNLQKIEPGHPFYQFSVSRPSIKKPINIRIPIVNQNKSKCLWKFIQHCTYEQYNSKNKIKSHDIVYFKHTKAEGLVSSTLAKPTEYYLKQNIQDLCYECFWQLIPKEVNQLGPQQCQSFRVRNVVTGQLLYYNDFFVQVQPQNIEGQSNGGLDNQGLINLVCSDQSYKLQRGLKIQIDENFSDIIKKYEQKFEKIRFTSVPKMSKDIFKIIKVDEKTLLDLQYALSSHQPLVKLIEVLASQLINQHKQDDKSYYFSMFFRRLDQDNLVNIITILKMLIGKIYNTSYQQIVASGNLPDKNMQKILVQTGIVQLVIQIINILYQPFLFIENSNQQQNKAIKNKISEIFQYSYRLLQKSAVNNENNRMYISRWVDLFLKHSNHINQSYIQECLVGILQNNPDSIQSTINKQKIKQLISSFFLQAQKTSADTFLTTKFLRLFSTFIVCEDRVILQNQNIILNQFFKNQSNKQIFKVRIQFKPDYVEDTSDIISKIRSKQVLIAFGKQNQQFSTISKFFRDWTSKWNYFIAYINLLADICIDRNNQAIKNVSALLSLQMVVTILFDPQMQKLNQQINQANMEQKNNGRPPKFPVSNVHEPFIRIAHYLYINNDKFDPVKRIKRISRWYKGEQSQVASIQQINRTKRVFQGQKQQQQQKYLKCILLYIKQYLTKATQNIQQLSMLFTILDLLKTTVQLGLWSSINQFRQLIPLIIMRITKIGKDKFFNASQQMKGKLLPQIVKLNKQSLKSNRPEISKSIQCKIKATQIFREMNQFQIDIRLRYIMNFFKGLFETTENFNSYDIPIKDLEIPGASQKDLQRNKQAKQEYFNNDKDKAILGNVTKIFYDQQIIYKQNVWLNKWTAITPFYYEPDVQKTNDRYLFQGGVLNSIAPDQNLKQAMYVHFQNIVLSLLELPSYQDYKLLNSSLRTLRSIFQQRKQLISNFKSILICGKGNLQQAYLTLKFMRNKFQMLTNANIVKYDGNDDPNFSFAIWKPYDSLIKAQDKRSGIIQDLFFLSRTLTMKENMSLRNIQSLMRVQEQVFDAKQVFSVIDQRQKNNVLFQALNLAQGIYIPLMEYVKIIGKNNSVSQEQIHYKLLRSIYQYLTQLCFNNLQAKQLMIQYIPYVLPHLSKKVGAAQFIYIVAYNNKTLISNQELVIQIIQQSLKACLQKQDTNVLALILNIHGKGQVELIRDYQISQIFYALRALLYLDEQGYHRNQQLLMIRLQDSKFKRLIFNQPIQYKSKIDNFDLNVQQAFVAAHFEMFSSMVESQNLINIGKLENIHKYSDCLESLKSTNRWQIRRALRAYINRLYYVVKQKDAFLFQQFIRKQFDIINGQLSDLINLFKNKGVTLNTFIKNGIRFKYALSEIMIFIIEVLITLHEMFMKSQFKKFVLRQLNKQQKYAQSSRPLHQKLIKLYRYLGCLKKLFPSSRLLTKFIKRVSELLQLILMNMQSKYIQKKTQPQGQYNKPISEEIGDQVQARQYLYDYSKSFFRNLVNMIRDVKERQERMNMLPKNNENKLQQSQEEIKRRCLSNIYKVPNQKLKPVFQKKDKQQSIYLQCHLIARTSRSFKIIAKLQLSQNEQNIQLNKRLGIVKRIIQDSPYFQKFRQQQHLFFVSILNKIDDTSSNYYASEWEKEKQPPSPVISMQQIITTIFTMAIKNPNLIKDQEKIFIVKLIRYYITQAIEQKQQYKMPIDKWQADYCKNQEGNMSQQFIKRQNLIRQCGGSDFIITILSQDLGNRVQLLNQILLLGISYLFGGNSDCQNSILQSLKQDPNNRMLLNIRKLIKKIGDFLIQVRTNKESQKKKDFSYNIADTYDYFSLDQFIILKQYCGNVNDKFQMQSQINYEKAMCRLFRFLQLFCQNNNVQMKKFLSTQINQDSSRKTNSANFIEEACLLLRKFFKTMNQKVVDIPQFLLSFIGQITQLPCLQNQISLIKSTFFEDISYLASFFQQADNKKSRNLENDDDPQNQLLAIFEQGILLALSNFQGNDPVIFSQFMNKCHPKYLWIVMRNNIWFLIKQRYSDLSAFSDFSDALSGKQQTKQNVNSKENLRQTMMLIFKRLNGDVIDEIISKQNNRSKVYEGRTVMILNIITIIKKLQDFGKFQNIQEQEVQKAQNFRYRFFQSAKQEYPQISVFIQRFENLILSIVVSMVREDGVISNQNLYFPRHPVFKYLSKQTKDYIMMEVKRDTRRDKLIDVLSFQQNIFSEIKWNYQLNYNVYQFKNIIKPYPFSITSDFCQKVRQYARNCSYVICILILFLVFVDHDTQEMSSSFTFNNFISMVVVRLLCIIQLGLTIFYCYLWGKMRGKLALQKYHQIKQQDTGLEIPAYQEAQQQKSTEGWVTIVESLNKFSYILLSGLSSMAVYIKTSRIWLNFIEPVVALSSTQSGFNSLVLFVIGSLLGNFYGVEWFTLHIFDYFANVPLLANIFKAIMNNIKILVIFSMLAGAFILVFNIISFRIYTPVIYQQDLPKQACQTILDCVLELYTSGAIGDDMDSFQIGRVSFDTIYIVFMQLLFQNLVGGIMIDAFAELKDNDIARDQDKKSMCYICAITVNDMEKNGQNFQKHIQKHFLWNYIYYIYCLKEKDETDYTGIQYMIRNQLDDEDISWFPYMGEDDSGEEIQGIIKELGEKINEIKSKSEDLLGKSMEAIKLGNAILKKKNQAKAIVE